MCSQQCLLYTELLEGREDTRKTGYVRVIWCVALKYDREKRQYFVFVLFKDSSPATS
jgi:hypothetical protein